MSPLPPDHPVDVLDTLDDDLDDGVENNVATKEHCFHAFDALYCAITGSPPVEPKFVDEK